jgi:diaminopimelate decarboxylase
LAQQFEMPIPTFTEYAGVIATAFKDKYKGKPWREQPALFLEPGSSLVANVLSYFARVVNIKNIRGKDIATVSGSLFNINARAKRVNPFMRVVSMSNGGQVYADLDLAGYTCVESDYLYTHYNGPLMENDFVVFDNVGSYSLSFKPPFIWPNVPVLEFRDGELNEVKRQEELADILATYQVD